MPHKDFFLIKISFLFHAASGVVRRILLLLHTDAPHHSGDDEAGDACK